MSGKNNGQELLQKYILGTITAKEEAQLLELAKKDAFLFDAIQGYRSVNIQDDNIKEIREEIAKKFIIPSRKGRKRVSWLNIAASVVLLFGIVWIFRNQIIHQQKIDPSLKSSTAEISVPSILGDDDSSTLETQLEGQSITNIDNGQLIESVAHENSYSVPNTTKIAKANVRTSPDYNQPNEETNFADESIIQVERKDSLIKLDSDFAITSDIVVILPPLEKVIQDTFPPNQMSDIAQIVVEPDALSYIEIDSSEIFVNDGSISEIRHYIIGNIKNGIGEPLSGATILLEGTTTGTITDVDGSFQIEVSENKSYLIIVSFIGYESYSTYAIPENQIHIVLDDYAALSDEVVVTGYSAGKKREVILPNPQARPLGGGKYFKEYVNKNQSYPDSAQVKGIHGKVKLRFLVLSNGEITDIEIINSLGYGCDEEAIRLLKEGPAWEVVPEGYNAWKRWTFRF